MTLRQRLTCIGFSVALALPSFVNPSALSQTPPLARGFTNLHPSDSQSSAVVSAEIQGDLLAARQRYLDAIEAYRRAPQDSAVLANKIGVAYHHMFDITDARKYYEAAIRMNPKYAEAYNNLGAIYHAEKNYKQAQRYYRKAIKLQPNSPLFYSNLGTAYFFQGNAKKGAEAYRQAFTLDPEVFERGNGSKIEQGSSTKDLATVNYCLAKTYAQAGMNDRALAYLRKALGEGFSDRKRLMSDRELASLRETPEFLQLLSRERLQ
jgi:tetratricopeptide (TPR) repeat protein